MNLQCYLRGILFHFSGVSVMNLNMNLGSFLLLLRGVPKGCLRSENLVNR